MYTYRLSSGVDWKRLVKINKSVSVNDEMVLLKTLISGQNFLVYSGIHSLEHIPMTKTMRSSPKLSAFLLSYHENMQ